MFLATIVRKTCALFLIAGGLAVASHGAGAVTVSGTLTAIMNGNSGYPLDNAGFFYPAGTSLVGKSITISYSYVTSGVGVAYTNGANSSLLQYSNAAAGSFMITVTANSQSYTFDGSASSTIDVDHNGSPSRYDFGLNFAGGGFINMNNITSSTAYTQGLLETAITNPLGSGFYMYDPAFNASQADFVNLQNMTATGSGASPVPEPSSLALLGASLAGLAFYRRRQSRAI